MYCRGNGGWYDGGNRAGDGVEPTKSVEFVVPAGTGGGADQMARFVQGVVTKYNLMKQPLVVVNKGGGAGAERVEDPGHALSGALVCPCLTECFLPPASS